MDSTTRDAALQDLLTRLGQGDDQAAATALMLYEPYLRMVVRRQLSDKLRAKFDSVDVVHSVSADVLIRFRQADCRFVNARHLQAFLRKAGRRRFSDHLRQHQKALECERPLAESPPGGLHPSPEPGPSEVARA